MTDVLANLEEFYAASLAEKATRWQTRNPEEAKTIREAVTIQFRRPGMSDPEPGTLAWLTLEAAIVEAIRAKKGWPTLRAFTLLQAGEEPAPPIVPLKIVPPKVDREDRQKLAAGDR